MTDTTALQALADKVEAGEVWTGSRKQKDTLRQMFGGKCAYCGQLLDKMHADHLEPIIRINTDPWGNPLPASKRRLIKPERNVVSNMMPACAPCNLHKGGYSLEGWREILGRASAIIAREKSLYRAALRLGLIKEVEKPVVFYFEELRALIAKEGNRE